MQNKGAVAHDPAVIIGREFHAVQTPRTKAAGADVDEFATVDARRRAIESRRDAGIGAKKVGRTPSGAPGTFNRQPCLSAVMRNNHARGKLGRRFAHEHAFGQRKEPHAVQLRQPSATKFDPSASAIGRRQHDADPHPGEGHRRSADNPADTIAEEADTPQRTIGRRPKQPPIAATVACPPDDAVIADGPARPLVQELDVVQVGVVLDR